MAVENLTPNRATLTNANVNGGTAVTIDVTRVRKMWKNMTKAPELKGSFDIPTVEMSGHSAPRIEMDAILNIDEVPTNGLTEDLLNDFCKETTADTTLVVKYGTTPTVLRDFDKGTSGIKVVIDEWHYTSDARTSKQGQRIEVKIKFIETK